MRTPRSSIQAVLVVGVLVITSLLINPNRATAGTPVQGPISTDTSWTVDGSPYWVEGDVVVLSPANLTVEPGVEVLFNGLYAIYVEGVLYSVGTPASAIDYTSNLSTPSPGDWKGLQVNATGRATIRHTNITYSVRGIVLEGSSNNLLESNTIRSNDNGVLISGGTSSTIKGNIISLNENGINCHSGCSGNTIEHNDISMNGYHGIRMVGYGNIIRDNTISGNGYAGTRWDSYWCFGGISNPEVQSAIYSALEYSPDPNQILNNTIAGNAGAGLAVDCGSQEHLEGNVIRDNDKGISIIGGHGIGGPHSQVTSVGNVIMENDVGVEIGPVHDEGSEFQNNDFIDNIVHVLDNEAGNAYGRNFWSGFSETCEDWERDGTCNTPYWIGASVFDMNPSKFPSVWRGPPGGQSPISDGGGPYFGRTGQTISFNGTGSSDPDGTIMNYYWDFGDGGFGVGPSPERAYWWTGSFSVLLIVWDDDYMWGMCNTTATIAEGFNSPHTPQSNGPVSGIPVPLPGP